MKKIIFIMVLAVAVAACHTQQKAVSGNKNYISWNKFNNDTLNYLRTNFDGNNFYIGKPVKVLLNDLEVPLIKYMPSYLYAVGDNYRKGLSLHFFTEKQQEHYIRNEIASKLTMMEIEFQEKVPYSKIKALRAEDGYEKFPSLYSTNSKEYQLYEEQIIKNIKVTPLIE